VKLLNQRNAYIKTKLLISAAVVGFALGLSSPIMAASDKGIDCAPNGGSPGTGANQLSEESQGGDNPFKPGIGNLAKSFGPPGNPLRDPAVLLNTFCGIQNGKGKGPGHTAVPD
jgi:hypothetical protein